MPRRTTDAATSLRLAPEVVGEQDRRRPALVLFAAQEAAPEQRAHPQHVEQPRRDASGGELYRLGDARQVHRVGRVGAEALEGAAALDQVEEALVGEESVVEAALRGGRRDLDEALRPRVGQRP
jgi:hypothetical protein